MMLYPLIFIQQYFVVPLRAARQERDGPTAPRGGKYVAPRRISCFFHPVRHAGYGYRNIKPFKIKTVLPWRRGRCEIPCRQRPPWRIDRVRSCRCAKRAVRFPGVRWRVDWRIAADSKSGFRNIPNMLISGARGIGDLFAGIVPGSIRCPVPLAAFALRREWSRIREYPSAASVRSAHPTVRFQRTPFHSYVATA